MRISRSVVALAIVGGGLWGVPSAVFAQSDSNYGSSPIPADVLPSASTTPTVRVTTATRAAGSVPVTGADIGALVGAGLLACGVGGALVLAGRRRASAAV